MSSIDTKENTGSGNTLDSNQYKQEPPDVNNGQGVVSSHMSNDKYFCHNEDHNIPLQFQNKSLKNYHLRKEHNCPAKGCMFIAEFNHEIAHHYDQVHVKKGHDVCDICCQVVTTLSEHKTLHHYKCNVCNVWMMDFPSLKQHEISCNTLASQVQKNTVEGEKLNFVSSLNKHNSLYLDKSPSGYNLTKVLSKMITSSSLSNEEKETSITQVNAYISQNMLARTRMRRKTPLHKETDLFFSVPSFCSVEETDTDSENQKCLSSVLKYCKRTIFDGEVDEAHERGWQNYLKLDDIFATICTVVTTCRLTEPQSVCILEQFLSSRVKDSVVAYNKAEMVDLTYEKAAKTIQYLFVPLDLNKIERITFGSNKSQHESMFEYAGKIRKCLDLCARRLPDESRSSYVEQHMRRLIYNNLKPHIKLQVEKRESIYSEYNSQELLDFCLQDTSDTDVNTEQYQSLYNVREESDVEESNDDSSSDSNSDSDSSESCSESEPISNLRPKSNKNSDPIRNRLDELKTYDSKFAHGLICLFCLIPGHNYKNCVTYCGSLSSVLHVIMGRPCGYHDSSECLQNAQKFKNLRKCDEAQFADRNVSVDQKSSDTINFVYYDSD